VEGSDDDVDVVCWTAMMILDGVKAKAVMTVEWTAE